MDIDWSALPQYGARAAYTLILIAFAAVLIREAFKVWIAPTPVIANFAFTKDGVAKPASSENFRSSIAAQLRIIEGMFSDPEGMVIKDDVRPAFKDIVIPKRNDWLLEKVEIKAQGVNFAQLLEWLRGKLRTPNEISGTVDEVARSVIVYAQWVNAPLGNTKTYSLQTTKAREAAFELAGNLIWTDIDSRVNGPVSVDEDLQKLLQGVNEETFGDFVQAWALYRHLSAKIRRVKLSKPDQENAKDARVRLETDINEGVRFPSFHLLIAYLRLLEEGKDLRQVASATPATKSELQSRLEEYQNALADLSLAPDPTAEEILAIIDPPTTSVARIDRTLVKLKASAPEDLPAETSAALRTTTDQVIAAAGVSVGAEGQSGWWATICCIVKDSKKQLFAVTPDFLFEGVPIDTPVTSPAQAVKPDALIIGLLYRVERKYGIALIRLKANVIGSNQIDDQTLYPSHETPKVGDTLTLIGTEKRQGTFAEVVEKEGQTLWAVEPRITSSGDAGAPVINSNSKIVAMGYASDGTIGVSRSLVLPLSNALTALNLTVIDEPATAQ